MNRKSEQIMSVKKAFGQSKTIVQMMPHASIRDQKTNAVSAKMVTSNAKTIRRDTESITNAPTASGLNMNADRIHAAIIHAEHA